MHKQDEEILIDVQNVSKKFSRDLKKSLKYGVTDLGRDLFGLKKDTGLRPTEFWSVNNVSFQVKRGECLGLIGHNGAGKSTLLKMLNGLINPDQGTITMRGKIGALIELGAGFNPILTGRENIYINGSILGFSKKEIDAKFDEIVAFSEIGKFIDTPVKNYSSGMKVRLGFSIAAQMEPDILLIDEVLAVGDVGFKIKCFNRIAELSQKCAVIFVSHSMPQVSRICNKAIFMVKGQKRGEGFDVPSAILHYYNSFDVVEIKDQFEGENIAINNITVTNQKGEKSLAYRDDLIFRFNLNLLKEASVSSFTINLLDKDYKAIAIANSQLEKLETGETTLEMIIEKIQLGVGTYFLNILFYESIGTDIRGSVVDQFQNIVTFSVNNSPITSSAPFQLTNTLKTIT